MDKFLRFGYFFFFKLGGCFLCFVFFIDFGRRVIFFFVCFGGNIILGVCFIFVLWFNCMFLFF